MQVIDTINKCLGDSGLVKRIRSGGDLYLSLNHNKFQRELRRMIHDEIVKDPTCIKHGSDVTAMVQVLKAKHFNRWVPYLFLYANKEWYFRSAHGSPHDLSVLIDFAIPSFREQSFEKFVLDVQVFETEPDTYKVKIGNQSRFDKFLPRSVMDDRRFGMTFTWSVFNILEIEDLPDLIDTLLDQKNFIEVVSHILKIDKRYKTHEEKFLILKYLETQSCDPLTKYMFFNMDILSIASSAILGAPRSDAEVQALDGFGEYVHTSRRDSYLIGLKILTGWYLSLAIRNRPKKHDPSAIKDHTTFLGLADKHNLDETTLQVIECLKNMTVKYYGEENQC